MHCRQKGWCTHLTGRRSFVGKGVPAREMCLDLFRRYRSIAANSEAPVGSFTRAPPPENQQTAFNCTDLRSTPSIGGLSNPMLRR
jgi:hypothetical protein